MREGIDSGVDFVFLEVMAKREKTAGGSAEEKSVLDAFKDLVGPEEIIEAACRLGAIKRRRKVDMPALVQATIVSVLPIPAMQTTTKLNYVSLTGQPLAHSSFYERFTPEFGALMRELASRAVEGVRLATPEGRGFSDFGVLLQEFKDVQVADSTCLLLQKLAQDWAPSTDLTPEPTPRAV